MSERAPAVRDRLTPNQLDKQRQIVEAAMRVLATRGLAACTAREVAAAGPLTKSAIHYYFADMDVLIDRAMAQHVANFEAGLRAAAATADDSATGFWSVVDAYLATFRDQPHVTHLWLEYWVDADRKGRTDAVQTQNTRITALLAEHLAAAGVEEPAAAARAMFVFLLGAILDRSCDEGRDRIRGHIAALAGLPTPPPTSGKPPSGGAAP
jgi:DNA-binding transcriptional regulator YbjK